MEKRRQKNQFVSSLNKSTLFWTCSFWATAYFWSVCYSAALLPVQTPSPTWTLSLWTAPFRKTTGSNDDLHKQTWELVLSRSSFSPEQLTQTRSHTVHGISASLSHHQHSLHLLGCYILLTDPCVVTVTSYLPGLVHIPHPPLHCRYMPHLNFMSSSYHICQCKSFVIFSLSFSNSGHNVLLILCMFVYYLFYYIVRTFGKLTPKLCLLVYVANKTDSDCDVIQWLLWV